MSDNAIVAHAKRFVRQQKHAQAAVNMLEKRQGRSTTTTARGGRETEVTVTRVRQTTRPTVVDDEEDETTTARGRTRAPAATTTTPAPAPAPIPTTSSRSSAAVIIPIASSVTPVIAPIAPLTSTSVVIASGGTLGEANGANATASKGGLSQGATIGVAVGAGIVGLLLLGFIGSTLYRRRKRQAAGQGDYSWSSREKDDLYGPSPSRNVMSDASFGNAAPSKFRPLSGEESRKMLLGGGAGAMSANTHNTTSFSEAMFSQPKPPTNTTTVPRASFMTGPQGPPPSVGALYGQPAAATSNAGPFDDSQQFQGKLFVVRRTFEPSLADELIIYPGDRIEIITCYDDGWCLGINLDSAKPGQEPQKGVFPRDCVEEIGGQDTPLSSGPPGLQRAPTLPPMPFEGGGPPAISVSSPGSVGRAQHEHHASSSGSHILSRFPDTPAHRESLASPRVKRTSSLIAGKDAELYRALGDAIDGTSSRRLLLSLPYDFTWTLKWSFFDRHGKDIVTAVSIEPDVASFFIADKTAAQHVLTNLEVFRKDAAYDALAIFGPNLATLEGAEWRRHRKIVSPTFTEARLITHSDGVPREAQISLRKTFQETIRVLEEWLVTESGQRSFEASDALAVTSRLSLSVIAAVGFGRQVPWSDDPLPHPAEDDRLPLYEALLGAVHNVFLKMLLPECLAQLPCQRIRALFRPYRDVRRHFDEIVNEQRADPLAPIDDILAALLAASKDEKGLRDDELLSNLFLMLLAGFDSNAQTLTYALTCLALYTHEQLNLLREINNIIGSDAELSYDYFSRLSYAHAIVMETTRLYPAATSLPRRCWQDTVIPTDDGPLAVPRWAYAFIHVTGLHYNPRYWGSDADVFRPSRFIDSEDGTYRWPRDAFFGWSTGPRSCVGRQLAMVELVAALCTLVSRYEITLSSTAFVNEGVEARRARILDSSVGVVLTIKRPVALVFTKR